MIVLNTLLHRYGRILLIISALSSVLGGLLVWFIPLQPWFFMLIPRIAVSALFITGLFTAGGILRLYLSKNSTREGADRSESPMLLPQPVYEHLYRTRMPRDLKNLVETNRKEEAEAAESFITSESKVLIISGPAGLGKSSLAALITRRVDFWLNIHHRHYGLREILYHIASWLEMPFIANTLLHTERIDDSVESILIDKIRSEDHRITLNGFDHFLDEEGGFIDARIGRFLEKLLTETGNHKVIFCSRILPWFCRKSEESPVAWSLIQPRELSQKASIEMIESQYEADDKTIVKRIAEASDGNPLLLNLLLPRLTKGDALTVLNKGEWQSESDLVISPGFLIELAGPQLPVLQKVAVMPEPLTKSFINSLASDTGNDVAKELSEKHLLIWDGGMKRYYCHPALIEVVFASIPDKSQALERVHRELADICVTKAKDFKSPDKWTSIADCRLYLHALSIYLRIDEAESAAELLFMLHPYLQKWGHQLLLVRHYEHMLERINAHSDQSIQPETIVRIYKSLIALYLDSGVPEKAAKLTGSLQQLGLLERNDVLRTFAKGKHLEVLIAARDLKQAIDFGSRLLRGPEDFHLAANLARYGHLEKARNEIGSAARYYHQSAVLFKKLGKELPMLKSIEYLAETYIDMKRYADAHNLLSKLRKKEDVVADESRYLNVELLWANCHIGLGDESKAVLVLRELMEKASKAGKKEVVISAHASLANLYSQNGNLPSAIEHLRKMEDAARAYGDTKNMALAMARRSKVHLQMNETEEALSAISEAHQKFTICSESDLAIRAESLMRTIESKAASV